MIISGIVTLSAFLLMGRAISGRERSAPLMALGLVVLATSVVVHVLRFEWSLMFFVTTASEYGLGSLLLAGLLRGRAAVGQAASDYARPWFFIGCTLLAFVVLALAAGRLNDAFRAEWLVELGPDDTLSEIHPVLDRYRVNAERAFPSVSLEENEDLAQVFILRGSAWSVWRARRVLTLDVENVDHLERNRRLDFLDPVQDQGPRVTDGSAAPVRPESGSILENDPLVREQWGLEAIRGHEAHALLTSLTPARRAIVAVLDTGVDGGHEDLAGSFTSSPAATDQHGHGSHVAGLAGAVTNNGIGMASLNWEGRFVEVVGYKALESTGSGTLELIAQAIVDATEDGVDVISMSLGAKVPSTPKVIADAVSWALRSGVIVVASAGNANEDARTHIPSNVPGVIVVTAVDENLRKAAFSNTTSTLAMPITAPGVNMISLKANGGYVSMSGTSMSTPVVSGLIGIMRALQPDLSAEEAWTALHSTGRVVADTPQIGRLVDAEAAIRTVLGERP